MRLFHRHRDDEAHRDDDEGPVNARIIRARLESIIDRQDSVYDQIARKLNITPPESRREQ